ETFYPPEVLQVDFDAQRASGLMAHRVALGVALEVAWTTKATAPLLFARAHRAALAVSLEIGEITPETLPHLLVRALRAARAVAAQEKPA
ncbi:MAG TPA: hypothetical protein VGU43_06260, partial [Thermoplasmata archaeon]|nr:hypothetical protein [Thermoplasmata archaeon]